ncbi:MAG: EamA family transporter [Bacteroidia bacterium]|nr:EamA family transporter [Bacteroidia bacterium]
MLRNTIQKRAIPLAFASIFIIWGSTFLAVMYGLKGFPPFILSGFRFLAAGLLLFAWKYGSGERRLSLRDWGRNALTGILILTGGTGLVAWGEQYVSSTEAAIAIATGPFWFIAIDRKNWKHYFADPFIIMGLVIGFIGLWLFLKDSVSGHAHGEGSLRAVAFIVLALSSVSWVIGSIFSRNYPAKGSTVMNTSQQLLMAGVASMLIATFRGEWNTFSPAQVPLSAWAGLGFLVFFGSIIAYLSYIWLLSMRTPAIVSTHTYINPVVAVIAGWLFLGETISGSQFYGLSVILAGVLLTNVRHYRIGPRNKVRLRRVRRQVQGFIAYSLIPLRFNR